jgi:hypothetical protein
MAPTTGIDLRFGGRSLAPTIYAATTSGHEAA